jgi:hypothetical protein
MPDEHQHQREDDPWSSPRADEPEPDWAEEIRRRRRDRSDRLKELFDGLADDDPSKAPPV